MWTVAEASSGSRLFSRLDPASWPAYKSSGKYGLSMRGPCFHPRLVRNRAHGRLVRAAAALLRCETRQVLCGHDRFTIYRPTHLPTATTGGVDAAVFRYAASPSPLSAVNSQHVACGMCCNPTQTLTPLTHTQNGASQCALGPEPLVVPGR